MAASSAAWSPAMPSIRSNASFASCDAGSMRSASARSSCPSASFGAVGGPRGEHARRRRRAAPFSRSHLATRARKPGRARAARLRKPDRSSSVHHHRCAWPRASILAAVAAILRGRFAAPAIRLAPRPLPREDARRPRVGPRPRRARRALRRAARRATSRSALAVRRRRATRRATWLAQAAEATRLLDAGPAAARRRGRRRRARRSSAPASAASWPRRSSARSGGCSGRRARCGASSRRARAELPRALRRLRDRPDARRRSPTRSPGSFEPDGTLADRASPRLRELRGEWHAARAADALAHGGPDEPLRGGPAGPLRHRARGALGAPGAQSDAHERFPGIVHATSAQRRRRSSSSRARSSRWATASRCSRPR